MAWSYFEDVLLDFMS